MRSAYAIAQQRMLQFSKITPKSQIKMQFSRLNNQNIEKPSWIPSRTKVSIYPIFLDTSKTKLVPHMLSHRENVQTSKFWQTLK
jgi:hypothetical protein